MSFGNLLRKHRIAATITVVAAMIAIAVFAILHTMPPRMIVMATGSNGGAYHEFGERYRAVLASAGVEVRLVPTAGSPENLALLLDPDSEVSVALIQGGIINVEASSKLESIGTVFYEPLWLFHKPGLRRPGVLDLQGRRISAGQVGSGTRQLSLELLKRNGVDEKANELLDLAPEAAGEKLLTGEIDAALMVDGWKAPTVQKLLADERVELSSFPRADAYVALYPFLNKVIVPRGVGDLAKDLPPSDMILFAPKASLIVRKDLHPAIQYLLLDAATQIHSGPGVFQHANQFPAAEGVDIPLSREAVQFYKSGRPFLHNFFPFWISELFGKLVILLIPILGLFYPIMRSLPQVYDWVMRSKILRVYGELRFLEDGIIDARRTGQDVGPIIAQLDQLEARANDLRIPVAYTSMLYMLRNHIDLVRERLDK